MNGLETKYLHYKTGKSEVTIPRKSLKIISFSWKHKDNVFLVIREVDGQKGLFLSKEIEGHMTRYLYYRNSNKSAVTIPRAILKANNLDWNNGDTIILVFKEIDGKNGLFLRKKKEN